MKGIEGVWCGNEHWGFIEREKKNFKGGKNSVHTF